MFWSSLENFTTSVDKVKNLSRDFIANRVSAAGVSYIIKERSRLRRHLWLIGVAGCIIFMGYMTGKVVSGYLKYPKMLMIEDAIMRKLPFPAVTLCSLNPISEVFTNETFLKKHIELKNMLRKAKAIRSNHDEMRMCFRDPLCKWSWFLESCVCVRNPCLTEFCIHNNESHCLCSSNVCRSKRISCSLTTDEPRPWNKNVCICDAADDYKPIGQQKDAVNLSDIISHIQDPEVRDIITLVWNSKSFDLTDVEEGLMPTVNEIYNYGISLESLIASCSFESEICNIDNFTILYHPNYGKCYMFNYVGGDPETRKKPLEIQNYGSNSGLRLLLRVTDQDSLDLVRREIGARIVIHDPFEIPFVAEEGVNVGPLDMAAIGVTMSTMTKLPYPWGNCVEDDNTKPYNLLGCEKQCSLDYMTQQCQCAMRNLLHGSVLYKTTTMYPLCDLTDSQKMRCVYRVLEELESRTVHCDCQPSCNRTVFHYTVTSSELNLNYYRTVKAIRTLFPEPDGSFTYVNVSDQKSMIGVKVHYSTFQVSRQMEVASYSWETLIANIGGNLGFFMGLTLVTFLEIIEFLWDVITTACCYRLSEENKVYAIANTLKELPQDLCCHKKVHVAYPKRKSI